VARTDSAVLCIEKEKLLLSQTFQRVLQIAIIALTEFIIFLIENRMRLKYYVKLTPICI